MSLINFFLYNKKKTADIAKKRLHIIIKSNKKNNFKFSNINYLKKEIIKVIKKCNFITEDVDLNIKNKKNNISLIKFSIKVSEIKS